MSRQYSRVFVSLKQDRAGYDFKGKEPSGRCVIEAKSGVSRLTVYIQDIKPEILYKAYIISSNHSVSEGLQIGTLNIDAKGKAELKWEFDADNVCGTGKAIEEFNVFAVIISAKNELISPLVGYKDSMTTWKNNFVVFSQDRKEQAEVKTDVEEAAVKVVTEETKIEVAAEEIMSEETITEDEVKQEEICEVEIEAEEAKDEIAAEEINEAEDEIIAEEISQAEVDTEEAEDEILAEEINEAEIDTEEAEDEIIAEEINEAEANEAQDKTVTEETAETAAAPEENPIGMANIEVENKKHSSADDFFETPSSKKEDFVELLNKEFEEAEIEAEERNNSQALEDEQSEELIFQEEPEKVLHSERIELPNDESKQDIHATFLEMAKNFNRELKELEQITFVKPDDIESAGIAEEDDTPGPGTLPGRDGAVIPASDGIDEMFRNNPPMRPFQKQNIDVSWIRISMREIIFLPLDHWKYMNHSFFVSAYNRFRHLILGKYEENGEDKYFLGVPEIYDSIYKKSAMSLGFTQFKCCEDVRTINGEYGYWIMPLQS